MRQGRQAIAKLGIFGHVAVKARRRVDHGAFARNKAGLRHVAAAFIHKQTLLGHVGQVFNVALVQRRVNLHAGVHTTQAVGFAGKFDVVPAGKALQLGPALPGGGKRAFVTRCLELGSCQHDFRPGRGRLVSGQAGGLESVLVEVKHGGRAVERKAQHLAVRRGVVAGHG